MNNIVAGVAARFALLDALRQRELAVFGPSTPGQPERQMKEMEHRSGTFFRGSDDTYHLPPAVPALSVSLTSIDAVTALCGRCAQKISGI